MQSTYHAVMLNGVKHLIFTAGVTLCKVYKFFIHHSSFSIMMKQVRILILFLSVTVPLGMVLVTSADLPAGETVSQWVWFDRTMPLAAACILATVWLGRKWEMPSLASVLSGSLLVLGGVEAVWGLRQLYGFTASGHSLYTLTGSFFNPGPYSGYLAMVLPVALHGYLRATHRGLRWAAAGVGLLILCVLPAGMSRSAWLAAGVSCLWVYGSHAHWGRRWKEGWKRKRRLMVVLSCVGLCLVLLGGGLLFTLKPDSARGRLFLWRMSARAAMEHSWAGHGSGNFAVAYGEAQERYFAAGDYEPWEERVAGSPEYAFNEYLQAAVEHGWWVLGVVLFVLEGTLTMGIVREEYGLCGALLAGSVFAFSSYPLQVPAFGVTGLALVAALWLLNGRWAWTALALAAGLWGGWRLTADQRMEQACREWTQARMLYQIGAYEAAEEDYRRLLPELGDKGSFLFEYGHGLHKLGRYAEADTLLRRAAGRSNDPMILNILGKNAQLQGDCEAAERWLVRSIHRLPGRIYPYYLLAKLYASESCRDSVRFERMRQVVLTKEPKVMSTAIREMREELQQLQVTNVPCRRYRSRFTHGYPW